MHKRTNQWRFMTSLECLATVPVSSTLRLTNRRAPRPLSCNWWPHSCHPVTPKTCKINQSQITTTLTLYFTAAPLPTSYTGNHQKCSWTLGKQYKKPADHTTIKNSWPLDVLNIDPLKLGLKRGKTFARNFPCFNSIISSLCALSWATLSSLISAKCTYSMKLILSNLNRVNYFWRAFPARMNDDNIYSYFCTCEWNTLNQVIRHQCPDVCIIVSPFL